MYDRVDDADDGLLSLFGVCKGAPILLLVFVSVLPLPIGVICEPDRLRSSPFAGLLLIS
jgi:hypothetical protein